MYDAVIKLDDVVNRSIYETVINLNRWRSLKRVAVRCPKCGSERLRALRGNKYLCEYCGYTFYACPVCGEFFERAWQLSSHMRRHRERRGEQEELKALLEEVLAGQKLILARLDQVLEKLDRVLALLSARPAPAAPPAAEPSDEELPDFLRDNPWLRMLGERTGGGG
jgi:predicted RNA-binding Zn-ribbon protein involved in translation (DUF1610 family)